MNYKLAWQELKYYLNYKMKMKPEFSVGEVLAEVKRLEDRWED